jgi:hypothetical protein
MLKTYYLISLDLKIVLTTLHKGEGGKNHCYRRERANKQLVSTIFARDQSRAKIMRLFHIFCDLFHVRAPLSPLTMLKTYYLISLDLKIVLTTLHKGEGGKNHCYRRERANKQLVSTIFARDCRSQSRTTSTFFLALASERLRLGWKLV